MSEVSEASMDKSAKARDKALEAVSRCDAATGRTAQTRAGQCAATNQAPQLRRERGSSGRGCLPITSGYSIAARFGQVGTVVALPHRFGLLLSRRYPIARSCSGRRHQRRDRICQRLGRQLCRYQVPEWHPHPDGSHVDRLSQRRPDGVGVPDRRRRRHDRKDLRRPRPLRGLPGWRGHRATSTAQSTHVRGSTPHGSQSPRWPQRLQTG